METQIIKLESPELSAIETSKAQQIKDTFEPMVAMLQEFEEKFQSVVTESEKEITKALTASAKRLRIDIGRVRIETEKLRIKQKEEYLRAGKAIDGVSNILKWAVTDKENRLKQIEDHFEILEANRLEKLQAERAELISPYIEDAHNRKLSDMDDDVWSAYFAAKKKEHEDRIEAEKQAEIDRIEREKAEAEERERIRIENERLKKEAEERDRLEKIEADKRAKAEAVRIAKEEAERKARETEQRKEREAHEAAIKESERVLLLERKAAEEKLKKEMDNARRFAEELRAKEEAERKAREEAAAKAEAELSKGDADKVIDLIADLSALKTKYAFTSQKNKRMHGNVNVLIDKAIEYINK